MKELITLLPKDKEQEGRDIYVLRHGQTLLNKEDKIRGWNDIPLDNVGLRQAEDLGDALVTENVQLDGVYSSDLLRSVQTSLEVSKITGIPILGTSKVLRPWNVGELTGTDGTKAHKIMSDYARNHPEKDLAGGESFNIFKHRFLVGIIGLLNSNRGLKLGFVSHSRGERILHGWVAAETPSDLNIDLDVFLARGEDPATAQELKINCPLILS